MPEIQMIPENKDIRSYRYHGDPELLYLVNEGTTIYEGTVLLSDKERYAIGIMHGKMNWKSYS